MDNCPHRWRRYRSSHKSHDISRLLKDLSVNLIIITVSALKNKKEIGDIRNTAKVKGKGILIEVAINQEKIKYLKSH